MGRSPCCSEEGLNRGAWTALEDKILTDYIKVHGEGRWRNLPKKAGLKRCGKSCRLRWLNYLRPDIKRGNISHDEEELIIRLHKLLGNRWSLIAGRLPGRTDNEIKNYWNTNLGKKMNQDHKNPTSKIETNNVPPDTDLTVPSKPFGCTKVENNDHPGPSMVRDFSSNTLSSFATDEDMSMDLNMEDMYLSDLLNSDFSAICDFKYDNDNELSPSDQMFQGLTMEDGNQHNIGSDFNCLASFLESGGDWLRQ